MSSFLNTPEAIPTTALRWNATPVFPQDWENNKLAYEGKKYVFIALFNLAILLLALFLPKLQDSVTMGLFLGSIGATFGATLRYFDTRSKIGFVILVITFFAMLYFINRKKESFVDWRKKN